MMNQEHRLYKEALNGLLPDREHIRKEALKQASLRCTAKRMPRWILPAAAAVVAIAVICVSVPPVRAAIAQWFTQNYSVQDYLAQPEEARPSTPELDTIIEQTEPEETVEPNSIEIASITPEWQAWADALTPSVGDVLFDGKELMVSFDMGGGAGELVLGDSLGQGDTSFPVGIGFNNPGYVIINGEKYGYGTSANSAASEYESYLPYIDESGHLTEEGKSIADADNSVPFTATIDFSRPLTSARITLDNWPKELPEGSKEEYLAYIAQMQQYDPDFTPGEYQELPGPLTGVQQVELHLPLMATDFSKPSRADKSGVFFSSVPIGMVKLCFSFDPAAGYATVTSYEIDQTGTFTGEGTYAWADRNSEPDYVTFVNKTIDMSGVKVAVKRMECSGTGAELYVSLTCPDSWNELDKNSFLSSLIPDVKGDGDVLPVSGMQYGLEEAGEDQGMRIHLNLLPSEVAAIDSFEITWTLERFAGYDDVPYVEGQPTRIRKDDVTGWQADSEELTDCAIGFSLK